MSDVPGLPRTSFTACSPAEARRLLLLDPYLAARAGHHYEFAEGVLFAARELGLRGHVFAHRRFRATTIQGMPAHGLFRERLWQRTLGGLALQLLGRFEFGGLAPRARRTLNEMLDGRREEQFARDVAGVVQHAGAGRHDIAFLPNMTHVETLGLARAFRDHPELTRRLSWHIEFHYPPANGRDSRHPARADDECAMRRALQTLEFSRDGQSVYCYTDTEELTRQYQALGVCDFETLPIPAGPFVVPPSGGGDNDKPSGFSEREQAPLTVVYIGDSRSEKGFELLPGILHDLWPDMLETGRLRFVIQSLINRRWKQRSLVRTQRALRRFPAPAVQIVERPLGGDEFRAIVAAGHIMLLPYARHAYAERSSGILAEALAAGIPAVVPAGTWLSRQLELACPQFVELSCRSHHVPPLQSPPAQIPGVIYSGGAPEVANALRQLAANYDSFRDSAQARIANWSAFHNPRRLLELLLQRESGSVADGRKLVVPVDSQRSTSHAA